MARVILGVGAGIAAYKTCELLRLLKEAGHRVRVVPTPDALRFVGEPTWAALSGEPVAADVWSDVAEVPHVRLGTPWSSCSPGPRSWPWGRCSSTILRPARGSSGSLRRNSWPAG